MEGNREQSQQVHNLPHDVAAQQRALAALQMEELKAKQQERLVRQYRRHKRRVLVSKTTEKVKHVTSKAKAAYTPRRALIAGLIVGIVIAGLWGLLSHEYKQKATKRGNTSVAADFKPAVPDKTDVTPKTVENNNFKIVTYQDTYNKASLIVSQQKLPDQFRTNPAGIKDLEQFKTADEVDTPKGTLYVTTNKSGQQWAGMVYGNILLFIQTNSTLSDSNWSDYIKNLAVK